MRRKFQGVTNIIRFNWHFYASAVAGTAAGLLLAHWLGGIWWGLGVVVALLVLGTTLASLLVSWYVYDYTPVYRLSWLPLSDSPASIINIHAGFDEFSAGLATRFPDAEIRVFDFYDPALHTEVSVQRARRAYPSYPGTERVSTSSLPLKKQGAGTLVRGEGLLITVLFSAHEIRDETECIAFFRQLGKAVENGGKIVVLEHLRDLPNFLAYTVGVLHFYSRSSWLRTFEAAGLAVSREEKKTPFLTIFTLRHAGTTP